jgi:hypothetical protein
MSAWLDSIISPLNAAGEGLQKLIEVRDLAKFGDTFRKMHGEVLAAMQGAIAAQTRQAALLDEVSALKKRVTDLEAWETEKQRYELVALAPNVMAYSIKETMRGTEPPHYICANCYQAGRKIFLNQQVQGVYLDVYLCGGCREELRINKGGDGPRFSAPSRRR